MENVAESEETNEESQNWRVHGWNERTEIDRMRLTE